MDKKITVDFNMLADSRQTDKNNNFFIIENISEETGEILPIKIPSHPLHMLAHLMLFCNNGELKLKVNFSEITLKKHDILLIKHGDIMEFINYEENTHLITSVFSKEYFDEMTNRTNTETQLKIKKAITNNPLFNLDGIHYEEYIVAIEQIKHILKHSKTLLLSDIIISIFNALLMVIIADKALTDNDINPNELKGRSFNRKETIFRNFINNVEKYYKKERMISYYAKLEYITPKYLSTVIYEFSNRHAGDWINEYVIQEAKRLLTTEYMSIQEVCYKLNFSNQSFFGKFFKRHTGMSPMEFRKSIRK